MLRWFTAMFSRWASWLLVYGVMFDACTSKVFKTLDDLIPGQGQDSRHNRHDFLCELRWFTAWCDGCWWILFLSICVSGYRLWSWQLRPVLTVCVLSSDLGSVEWLDSHWFPSSWELGERKGAAVSSCLSVLQAPSILDAPGELEACYLLLSFRVELISLTASTPVVEFRAPSLSWSELIFKWGLLRKDAGKLVWVVFHAEVTSVLR